MKRIEPGRSLNSKLSKSFSDSDIRSRNKVILASLASSTATLEALKSWEVVDLSLFYDDTRAQAEALLLKNITSLQDPPLQ